MADLSFYVSPLSEEIREEGRAQGRLEGRAQGRLEGRAESILIILGARGIDVTHATREKIITCGDPELRRQWLVRAVHATTAEEIFAGNSEEETAAG
ncbi:MULTISPECIES: hypothetical protein [unclassified Streptomyces]|uniref:hypothetical protein n=1 Tax=unclassified Streptomyces TaxID=2593676 RepID=UPI000CD59761|nr:hypothetical protein [Streptomyces sp. SM10]